MNKEEKEVVNMIKTGLEVSVEGQIIEQIHISRKEAKALLNLIQKQEKIIDEMKLQIYQMAKYISYLDIEEDICVKNVTNPQLCNEEYINCIECIKEYFKKVVDEDVKD